MKTDELREKYLEFFETKGCVRRPSDVLVPRGDPTVLFTPAGMNQFKDQFLGVGKLDFTRATTCQKCLRTGDIENVGNTAYHHTFFEMLGNFSFGDYFKNDAIHWAWEFLTDKKWLGLDPQRLTVTVFQEDEEAYGIWHDKIGLSADRITRDNEHENFWPAGAPSEGPDGVCGPCSEIFYHPPGSSGNVEIWNLVFTQFNRVGDPPDNLRPLPKKNIDTGMGLERTAAVLQGHESNFEIDTLRPLCEASAAAVGVKYAYDSPHGRAVRRIADHVRAVTFAISEGVLPDRDRERYVIRQLLRRAVMEGFLIGQHDPFLHTLVPNVAEAMQVPYPELGKETEKIAEAIRDEEEQFLGTVEKGLHKLDSYIEKARGDGKSVLSGDDVFDLHQTDGFLIELTEAVAAKHNLSVDRQRFNARMQRHLQDSGRGAFADKVMAAGPLDAIRETQAGTDFVGYDETASTGKVVGIIAEGRLIDSLEEVGHDDPVGVVLDCTPFYGEAGGQVGDTGTLTATGLQFDVADTQREGDYMVHIGHLKSGTLQLGMEVTAEIDTQRRAGIRRAHSATHLLHHALHKYVGEHALQRGSKVDRDTLRFDFSQPRPVTSEQISQIEDEVNRRIAEGAAVSAEIMELKEAKKLGAMALFGEKYPDRVRMVSMGDFSKELCGGTHLVNTGQVGLCKIISEEGTQKGVRRITALTGERALEKIRHDEALLKELAQQLKTPQPDDLPQRVNALQEELKRLKRELSKQTSQSAASAVDTMLENAISVGDVKIVGHEARDWDVEMIRAQIDQIRRSAGSSAVLIGSITGDKVILIAGLSKDLVQQGLNASDWVKTAAKIAGGGGGGRPDFAQAGAKHPEKLGEAIAHGTKWLQEQLEK
ncbi:Alanine--tRNA ligase [Symmachiella dynata]|uniref:alanine--tRNA ligase n=1 Tax=Symmachiella dynata TaxID=2527995 RepID=UPI00118CB81F|nr:alanine--tRNA ligase [Symmachiella dynata]QDT47388.1 Alanine--tRNA ligase [Symmachiella dynata]